MILSAVYAAGFRAVFPQKPLEFLCIQALRDCRQVYDTDRNARGQKPAFTEDLSTPVLI